MIKAPNAELATTLPEIPEFIFGVNQYNAGIPAALAKHWPLTDEEAVYLKSIGCNTIKFPLYPSEIGIDEKQFMLWETGDRFEDLGVASAETDSEGVVRMPFEFELEPAHSIWSRRPGEHLSVFDSITDLSECKERTGANATVGLLNVKVQTDAGSDDLTTEGIDPGVFDRLGKISQSISEKEAYCTIYLGDRNNPFFTNYSEEFQRNHPEAYMQDIAGRRITVEQNPILGVQTAVPAVDDPTITRLASQLIREGAAQLRDNRFVTSWVIGTEEAYPDYFGLPLGDFRPASRKHFKEYLCREGWQVDDVLESVLSKEPTPIQAAWYRFREQAMADRAAAGMQDFLAVDPTRPVFYPTHGHPFSEGKRRGLGLSPTLLLGACDGLEMGHITIDDDREALNLLFLTTFTSMGAPVIVPRLGNKTLDTTAQGGGRSLHAPDAPPSGLRVPRDGCLAHRTYPLARQTGRWGMVHQRHPCRGRVRKSLSRNPRRLAFPGWDEPSAAKGCALRGG